jgi:hypothetical protein
LPFFEINAISLGKLFACSESECQTLRGGDRAFWRRITVSGGVKFTFWAIMQKSVESAPTVNDSFRANGYEDV